MREKSVRKTSRIQTLGDEEPVLPSSGANTRDRRQHENAVMSESLWRNWIQTTKRSRAAGPRVCGTTKPAFRSIMYTTGTFRLQRSGTSEMRRFTGSAYSAACESLPERYELATVSGQRSEAEAKTNQDLRSMRDEIVPYFNAHCTLSQQQQTYISELEALPVGRTDRINGSSVLCGYRSMCGSRQQMNLTSEPQMLNSRRCGTMF